jgi:hypothetical protein
VNITFPQSRKDSVFDQQSKNVNIICLLTIHCCIFGHQCSVQESMEKLNHDLENLSKWLKFNKLKLNVSNTKYIIMTGRRSNIENGSTALIIDGEQIARATTMKYLGIEIYKILDFKQHVNTSIKKMEEYNKN